MAQKRKENMPILTGGENMNDEFRAGGLNSEIGDNDEAKYARLCRMFERLEDDMSEEEKENFERLFREYEEGESEL